MKKIQRYIPLIIIILLSFLSAMALLAYDDFSMARFMQLFMGVFLVQFSALKLFDLSGFAKGFAKYDLLAKRSEIYGHLYPFIELTLALGYLSNGARWGAQWVYIGTIVVMGFGAIGVLIALLKGLNTNCACLGTSLKVPLSTVAITENISMVIMASILLFS